MKILGIDSSTDSLSVGLADDRRILAEKLLESRREHASHIIGVIDDVLTEASQPKTALGGIGVAVGPGSFTGLRIGMAVAKGLALALDIPIIGISTFEVIAARLRDEFNHFYLAASARKGEYYLCRISAGSDIQQSFSLVETKNFSGVVGDTPVGFIGGRPEELSEAVRTIIPPEKTCVSGGELAVQAAIRLADGKSDSLSDLEPLYIAPSQAERKFGRQ